MNVRARFSMEDDKIEVVWGVNPPMLLERAVQREGTGLHEPAFVKKAGTGTTVIHSEKKCNPTEPE